MADANNKYKLCYRLLTDSTLVELVLNRISTVDSTVISSYMAAIARGQRFYNPTISENYKLCTCIRYPSQETVSLVRPDFLSPMGGLVS